MGNMLINGTTKTSTPRTFLTSSREVDSTVKSTDDPLDGPIVETLLNSNESPKINVGKDELEQIVDGKHESLVLFENKATSEPIDSRLSWVSDNRKTEEYGPSFSTVALPIEDSFITTKSTTTETTRATTSTPPLATTDSEFSWQKPFQESIDVTIIPTMAHADWTVPPIDEIEDISLPLERTDEEKTSSLDSQADSEETESSGEEEIDETSTELPATIETAPLLIDNVRAENLINRVRVMGTKMVQRDPIELPSNEVPNEVDREILPPQNHQKRQTEIMGTKILEEEPELVHDEIALNKENLSDAFSVLKLPETAIDAEKKQLEETFGSCIKSRLGQRITEVEPMKCDAHSLPPTLGSEPCHSKLHVIRHHCSKLAHCCSDVPLCRNEVDRSDAARQLRRRKESVALASAKCHIQSYKDYRKRIKLKKENYRLL
ncbi:unnamed protein product [Strongylus vulgaris]|uniref:Uncharacterized protein n=1 Tax=Strongylus vulgaris TaxID=40348 RepID=A0A3P7IE97_STRVU|nr:unnamed protein product [Strongylus vulgaris]